MAPVLETMKEVDYPDLLTYYVSNFPFTMCHHGFQMGVHGPSGAVWFIDFVFSVTFNDGKMSIRCSIFEQSLLYCAGPYGPNGPNGPLLVAFGGEPQFASVKPHIQVFPPVSN